MIRDQQFQIVKTDKEILQTFYPLLAFRILDDSARTPDSTDGTLILNAEAEPLETGLLPLIERHPLAHRVVIYPTC